MPKTCIELIQRALPKVDEQYFRLGTTYEPSGIVRERVFCYELYHQIRQLMTEHHPFSLNGEIDKRGHIDFEVNDRKNPDFVFHVPKTHEGNTVVVEVKGNLTGTKINNQIKKDFKTIFTFIEKYNYKAGVFILYNHSIEDFFSEMGVWLVKMSEHPNASDVHILTMKYPYSDPCVVTLANINIVSDSLEMMVTV